ncbi:MAG: metallopeptidase TldD-related protein, partial [Planctomycetota bacterium]
MTTSSRIICALVLIALPLLASPVPAEEGKGGSLDLVMMAMVEEMSRNMERLKTEELEAPYHMGVTVRDVDTLRIAASFGGVTTRNRNRTRRLSVQVRVGGHDLDQTNFSGGGWYWGSRASSATPLDDDEAALRQAIWLRTDNLFKSAHEDLARKKAWLEMNNVKDRPPDFTGVPAHRHIEDLAVLTVDEDGWESRVRTLSLKFREFPEIQTSSVSLSASATNRRFVTSDGFRTRRGVDRVSLTASATAQAEDGMPLRGQVAFSGRTVADLPGPEEMEEKVTEMATLLSEKVKAQRAEEYLGPVLLEKQAAAQLFLSLLTDQLESPREPLGSRGRGGTVFKNRLHRRVLPTFLSVYDDPTVTEHGGKPLLGSFPVDDDGVPAKRVNLVEKGKLRSWF